MGGVSTTRSSEAPMLDAYATQRCEVRLQLNLDPATRVLARRTRSEAEQRRIDAGNAHEAAVLLKLREGLGHRLVEITAPDRSTAQRATLDALENQVEVIAGAWLPADQAGRRVGRPDLLVRALDGYLPVEIKLHLLRADGSGSLDVSPLDDPLPRSAVALPGSRFRKGDMLRRDALQLVHYRRMLAALGHAASGDGCLGGVVDGSLTLFWLDLAAGPSAGRESFEELYDRLFAERLALSDKVLAWIDDSSLERPLDPWWHKECERCPFEEVCHDELSASDDVSLVRWSSTPQLEILRRGGVTTRRDLAALDLPLVDLGERLAETSLPLPSLLEQARLAAPSTSFDELVGARMGVRRRLHAAGLQQVSDLLERDGASLELAGRISDLGRLVRRARAHLAGGAARRVTTDRLDAARADVEVDVDMESYGAATYLWGALVTSRDTFEGIDDGYRSFAEFGSLDEADEARIFGGFWDWLITLRTEVRRQGGTFRAYCFWRAAEEGQMRRAARIGGDGLPTERQLDRFFASDEWVDLHEVVKDQIMTEGPLGLKVLATRAGFSWRDEDPSGEASIGWYELARDGDHASLQRLLDYNEDDVRATRALRDWLEGDARLLPHLDDLGAPGR